jgi:hypothetical protein
MGSGRKIRGGHLRRPGHEPVHSPRTHAVPRARRPIAIEILSALRLNETGVAAAFGVVLMLVSALVLGLGARR